MVLVPDADFLWASDYIQSLRAPTLYAEEVMRATIRHGLTAEWVAAQHLPLTRWTEVQKLLAPRP